MEGGPGCGEVGPGEGRAVACFKVLHVLAGLKTEEYHMTLSDFPLQNSLTFLNFPSNFQLLLRTIFDSKYS